jgi:hypothetical protein
MRRILYVLLGVRVVANAGKKADSSSSASADSSE